MKDSTKKMTSKKKEATKEAPKKEAILKILSFKSLFIL